MSSWSEKFGSIAILGFNVTHCDAFKSYGDPDADPNLTEYEFPRECKFIRDRDERYISIYAASNNVSMIEETRQLLDENERVEPKILAAAMRAMRAIDKQSHDGVETPLELFVISYDKYPLS